MPIDAAPQSGSMTPRLSAVPDQMAVVATIRLVREWRGLMVKDLAERVGVTSSYVSKAELGQTQVTGRALEDFAAALSVRPGLLTREIPTQLSEGIHFRSQSRVTQRARKRAIANMNLVGHVLGQMVATLGDADFPRVLPEYDVDRLEGGAVEAAQLVRRQWRLDGPIVDMAGVLEAVGVIVLPLPADLIGIDALTVRVDTDGIVAVLGIRDDVPEDRKRHTLAHELGHLVMDQQSPQPSAKAVEERADMFAGEFLAPYDEIGPELEGITPAQVDVLHALRARWGVSLPALVRRAYLGGAINETQYRYWFRVLNARNLMRGQQGSSYPLCPHLAQHVITEMRALGYSMTDIVDITDFDVRDLQSTLGSSWPYPQIGRPLSIVPDQS